MLVPAVIPETIPVVEPTVALPLLLLHKPPDTKLLRVVVDPVQTDVAPIRPEGSGLTVTTWISVHPAMA